MKNKKEINAGIIIIGNEVLSGRTKDINTSTLSLWLNSLGVQVKEVRINTDIEKYIIETIKTIKNNKPVLLVEIEERHTKTSITEIITFINSIGYKAFISK